MRAAAVAFGVVAILLGIAHLLADLGVRALFILKGTDLLGPTRLSLLW